VSAADALPEARADRTAPDAEVIDLFKVYREGEAETVALRGASLRLRAGEFVSLMGPSGSGKSTLLAIMAGLMQPTAGRVLVGGHDLSRLDESERAAVRAEKIGLVFQRGNLVPFLTAEENVVMAMEIAGHRRGANGRARDLLAALGLAARLRQRPHQLSGGEVQRVGIAVALANDPDLLLGDELTGELDSESAAQVMELLLGLRQQRGLTLLVVTHNPNLAAAADRQLVIADGLIDSI
jgi:putative ABC transport system ATP-binding protein